MAQVVQAEPGDELVSLIQKLEAAQEPDLILLVPRHTAYLQDSLHWNLLQRHIRAQGKLIVVVTQDRRARKSARHAGFAVYRSLRRLKFTPARSQKINLRPLLKRGRGPSLLVTLGAVALGGLLLLGLIAYLILPTGSVILWPKTQDMALTISVRASQQASGIDADTGQIPARLLTSPLEGTDTMDTTGQKSNPTSAHGEVTLLNRTPFTMLVPISTTLATAQGVQFMTADQVVLPPSGGTARTSVVASQPGLPGNVSSMAIDHAMVQPYASALSVWNELPTFGGSEDEVAIVSAQDQSNLRSRLMGRLTKDGQNQLQALKTDSESIYPETITLSSMEESFDKKLGDEASSLTLQMKGGVSGLAFDGKDVNLLAQKSLEAQAQQGFHLLPDTIQVTPLEAFDWGNGWVAFHVKVSAKASATVDSNQTTVALRGKTLKDAQAYLDQQFPEREQLNVSVEPLPLDWIPVYVWKFEVRY